MDLDDQEELLYKSEIIFNGGEVMCSSFGASKDQATRNASIMGLKWLKENKT